MPVETLLSESTIDSTAQTMRVSHDDARRLLILAMWENVRHALPWLGADLSNALAQFLLRLEAREGIALTAAELAHWSRELPDRSRLGVIRKPARINSAELVRVARTLTTLAPNKRREAARRYLIVRAWEAAKWAGAYLGFTGKQTTRRFIAVLERELGIPICGKTLFNWRRDLSRASGNPAGLADRRSGGHRKNAGRKRGA